MIADVGIDQIHVLIIVHLEIDDAVVAEAGNAGAGLGV